MPPTAAEQAILDAILAGPLAWRSSVELVQAIGLDLDKVLGLVAGLEGLGWVAIWERGADSVVTLTPWAAEQLGVRLVEVGPAELPRWLAVGKPEPSVRVTRWPVPVPQVDVFGQVPRPKPVKPKWIDITPKPAPSPPSVDRDRLTRRERRRLRFGPPNSGGHAA